MLLTKCVLIHILAIVIRMTIGDEGGNSHKECGKDRECVPQYLCRNGKINRDGVSLLDIRATNYSIAAGRSSDIGVQDPTTNGPCSFAEICCTKDNTVIEDNNKTLPIVEQRFFIKPIRPAGVPPGCGYRNSDEVGPLREDPNNTAKEGEFPWMVAILLEETSNGEKLNIYQCGGSLITPRVVLTGAICVHGRPANSFKVRAGDWQANSNVEQHPHQDRQATDMVIHKNFNPSNLHNDVAMLIFDLPFDLAPNVNTICLPENDHNFDISRCYVTGWGKNDYRNGRYQTTLKKIVVPVVPNHKCQADLRHTRLGKYFELHSSFMCAGGERGKDACKGDGGSPLVCPTEGSRKRFYQAGIVAWGISCGEENVPGVYASVPHFRLWIAEQLAYKEIGSEYFIM